MISFPLSLPTSPGVKRVTMRAMNVVGVSESPFTRKQQVYEWSGDQLAAGVTMPPMSRANAEAVIAQLLALRGRSGTFYLGDPSYTSPRGTGGGTPVINAPNTSGRVLGLSGGYSASQTILRAGDYIQVGTGWNATRITSTGGSTDYKYFYSLSASALGNRYTTSVRIKNLGAKTVTVKDDLGNSTSVATGVETQVILQGVGDGSAVNQLVFYAPAAGDSIDFVAWDPVIRSSRFDQNLIPVANRDFTGWNSGTGATVTLVQNYNQRFYKAMADAVTDGGGDLNVEVFPSIRPDAVAAGDPVTFTSCKGIFRLANNERTWDIDEAKIYGISFEAVEAL